MRKRKVILIRAERAAKSLIRLLDPLGEALFPSRGACPSCGREALWIDCLPGRGALCLKCRRAMMELFRWEDGPLGNACSGKGARTRGRISQCAALPPLLSIAIREGGPVIIGQAASAIASLMPFDAYFAVEGVYAQAGHPGGMSARLSPYARALAAACEADFLGIVPTVGVPLEDLAGSAYSMVRNARASGTALVVMQAGASRQGEEEMASRIPGTGRIIYAYLSALWQDGAAPVI